MRIICVDGDAGALARAVEACRSMAGVREVRGFLRASEALEWTGEHPADIAVLEIMLPETDGLTLAEKLRQTSRRRSAQQAVVWKSTDKTSRCA